MKRTIPTTETLTVEFKSDRPKSLPDDELLLAVVCLANTDGGTLYVGVEDDGTISGLQPHHIDPTGMAAMIANRTVPSVSVRVNILEEEGQRVAQVDVPRSTRLVATNRGTLQRRRLKADGTPECVAFLPHEFATHQSDLGLLDYSALPVQGATLEDLDPLERQRLRQAIERYRGDASLVGLDDAELDGALGLVTRVSGLPVPTVAGLLLIGKEGSIRAHLPTHEVAFQVLEEGEVRVNDFYHGPLIRVFERIEEQFTARLSEREVQVGLFRVAIPTIDRRAFRESVVNAFTHRDWTRPGAIHIRWEDDALVVSNPGGFVEGVTLDNLLSTEPRPRNPRLADDFKRLGLAERTGRGVDLIYKGLLRYGRPAPSYHRSTAASVVVEMSSADADLPFLEMILEAERRRGSPLPLNALLVLSRLREEKRMDAGGLAEALHMDPSQIRATAERLVEAGLVQAQGNTRARVYMLSPQVYGKLGKKAEAVRQAGFDAIQQVEMIRKLVRQQGRIRRQDVMDLCHLNEDQATRLLKRLVTQGLLQKVGERRWTTYMPGPNA